MSDVIGHMRLTASPQNPAVVRLRRHLHAGRFEVLQLGQLQYLPITIITIMCLIYIIHNTYRIITIMRFKDAPNGLVLDRGQCAFMTHGRAGALWLTLGHYDTKRVTSVTHRSPIRPRPAHFQPGRRGEFASNAGWATQCKWLWPEPVGYNISDHTEMCGE